MTDEQIHLFFDRIEILIDKVSEWNWIGPFFALVSAFSTIGFYVYRHVKKRREEKNPVGGKYFASYGQIPVRTELAASERLNPKSQVVQSIIDSEADASSLPAELTIELKSVLDLKQTGLTVMGKNTLLDGKRSWNLRGRVEHGIVQGTYDEVQKGKRPSSGTFALARGPGVPSQLASMFPGSPTKPLQSEDFFGGWMGQDPEYHAGEVVHGYYLWRKTADVVIKRIFGFLASRFAWIHKQRLEDATVVLRESLGTYIEKKGLKKRLKAGAKIKVAYLDGKAVGAIVFSVASGQIISDSIRSDVMKTELNDRNRVGFLEHLAVHREFRGRGIASTLLELACDYFNRKHCSAVAAVSWVPLRKEAQTSFGLLTAFRFHVLETKREYWVDEVARDGYCPECKTGKCRCSAHIMIKKPFVNEQFVSMQEGVGSENPPAPQDVGPKYLGFAENSTSGASK